MLPAGGVKAMLALIVELLACALTGSHFGFETESFFVDEGGPARLGQAFMAIDPGALAGNDAYRNGWRRWLTSCWKMSTCACPATAAASCATRRSSTAWNCPRR